MTAAQITIAICASVLLLVLLRRLLPHYLACIIAAWWALLPINFDSVYNVHLFSVLIPLVLFITAAYFNNIYGRGTVLAGLLLTAALVRSEYTLLFMIWLFLFVCYELYAFRQKKAYSLKTYLLGYVLPLLLVLFILGGFYARAISQYPEIQRDIQAKRTLFVCQNYAYNRKQQGDAWQGDPWTECQELIERDFKSSAVTFSQAFSLNPGSILKHIWWNIRLIPSGTQLALFNYYSGGPNPDFMRAQKSPLVWLPFVLAIGLCIYAAATGFILPFFKKNRPAENVFAWLLMFSSALMVLAAIIMARPRPSYMFPYSIFLMALSGLGLGKLLERISIDSILKPLTPIGAILLILFVPSHYDSDYINHYHSKGQPWRETFEQIAPHINRGTINSPAIIVIPTGNYESLCNYLGVTCLKLPQEDNIAGKGMQAIAFANPGENAYLVYLEDMIWKVASMSQQKGGSALGYVELNCFSLVNDILTCSDGTIDLKQGFMNDGQKNIPLRAALFINDGYVVDRRNYKTAQGYYLQVIMREGQADMTLVTDESIYRTYFNQQFLLGNYDRGYFKEIYNNSPLARILQINKTHVESLTP
jgi:hypothetical protein